jgi:hypothetical protein
MNKQTQTILKELYALDERLMDHEKDLIKIVETLIKEKPEIEIDKNFIVKLKKQLMQTHQEIEESKQKVKSFSWIGGLHKLTMRTSVIALTLLVVVGVGYVFGVKYFSFDVSTKVAERGFGDLVSNEMAVGESAGVSGESAFGLGSLSKTASSVAQPENEDMVAVESMKMIAPFPGRMADFEYSYSGIRFDMSTVDLPVYRRDKTPLGKSKMSQVLNNFKVDLMNLQSFGDMNIRYFSLYEDSKKGYQVHLDFEDGNVSVSRNWNNYQVLEKECLSKDCLSNGGMSYSDVPEDSVVIGIANKFLQQRGIGAGHYAKPEVQDNWRTLYAQAKDKATVYIPSSITVVYPYLVDGLPVYMEGGEKVGLQVTVDLHDLVVNNVYNLRTMEMSQTTYDLEKDFDKVLKYVEQGGFRPIYYGNSDAKEKVKIEFLDPELAYMQFWQYKDGQNYELFLPALVFPVKDLPKNANWHKKNLVIPLVQEILKEQDMPKIGPMPVLREVGTATGLAE